MTIGLVVSCIGLVALAGWVFAREQRRQRWESAGMCHRCGDRPGIEAIALHYEGGSKRVHLCPPCVRARRRTRWWTAGFFALLALAALAAQTFST